MIMMVMMMVVVVKLMMSTGKAQIGPHRNSMLTSVAETQTEEE